MTQELQIKEKPKTEAVPKLRFREFEEVWNIQKLGELVNIKSGHSPSSYSFLKAGAYPFFKVEELNNSYKYQEESRFFSNNEQNLISENAVIFPKRGAAILSNKVRILKTKAHIDSNLMAITPKNDLLYHGYLFYSILSAKLFKLADTSTIPQINNKHIEPYKITLPNFKEQQKIASFLSAVDKKIQQLTCKKELLETYKKGVMQQLFSQEIRFKDEDGKDFPEWERFKLGELGDFIGGGTPDTNVTENWEGNIPWVSSSDILEDDINSINIHRFINLNSIKGSATKIIPENSILIVSRVGIGKLAINKTELCTSQDFSNLIPHRDNVKFLAYYLYQFKHLLNSIAQGTSIKGFTISDIRNLKMEVPSISEQQKIADFLSAIDKKIEAVSQQINKTQSFKKGLLQQMFV